MYDIIVVGGGAAGLIAAGTAANYGKKILLIEKNKVVGKKIRITGKGRCNVCNNCSQDEFIANVPGNGRFLYSAINTFTASSTIDFFESLGVKLKTERAKRVFPVSDNAHQIADALYDYAKDNGVELIIGTVSRLLVENNQIKGVVVGNSHHLANNVLLATGGVSYKGTGSTGDGHKFAQALGHTINELKPSLVALTSSNDDCREMQGLSLKNSKLKLLLNDKCIFEDFGEMLFTHFGVSGPLVLSASAHMRKKGDYKICIDIKPALSIEQLDKRLIRDFEEYNNKNFENYLKNLLPSKMISVIIKRSGIPPELKCNTITKAQRQHLCECLKNFYIEISGFRPIDEAIVTSGGVNTKEINPKTMESKIIKGLYFAGELIDVDAYTGGFNLQIAFSTGYLAAINM